uniref:Uncharacterized protein n=1 Tax=Pipistrellus kuhlii TaxID=59472 RepID=A0A7J7RMZ3_PIPKU|nr:hypothetical protein mPipKuh1_010384 [Pipistrellus kuhlii]
MQKGCRMLTISCAGFPGAGLGLACGTRSGARGLQSPAHRCPARRQAGCRGEGRVGSPGPHRAAMWWARACHLQASLTVGSLGVDGGAGRPVGTQRCAWGPWDPGPLVTRSVPQQSCGQWCGGRRRLCAMSSGQGSRDELQAEGGHRVTGGKMDEPQIQGGRASLGQGAGRRGCRPAGRSREAQRPGLTNTLPFQCLFTSEGNTDCNHNEHTMVNSAGITPVCLAARPWVLLQRRAGPDGQMPSLRKSRWAQAVRSVPGPGVRSGDPACGLSEGRPGQVDTGRSPVRVSVHTCVFQSSPDTCVRDRSPERRLWAARWPLWPRTPGAG